MTPLTDQIAVVVARHSVITGLGYSRTRCGCGEVFFAPYVKSHAAHVAEQVEAELPPALSPSLMEQLQPEGSALLIQKASSNNLDWTWRVRYQNGVTGQEDTRTGSSLPEMLSAWSAAEGDR